MRQKIKRRKSRLEIIYFVRIFIFHNLDNLNLKTKTRRYLSTDEPIILDK
jgi:hypothetical protein